MTRQPDQYYIKLVKDAQLASRQPAERQKWALRLAVEQQNLRAVFGAMLQKGQLAEAFDFTVRQVWYLYEQGDFGGLQERYEAIADKLRHQNTPNSVLLGKVLRNAATFAQLADRSAIAVQHYSAALALTTEPAELAALHNNLAILHVWQGELQPALVYLQQAGQFFQKEQLWNDWAGSQQNLALIKQLQGQYSEAAEFFAESRQHFAALGNQHGLAEVSEGQATLALNQANFDEATELAKTALASWQTLGDLRSAAGSYLILAEIKRYQQDLPEAIQLFEEAARLYRQFGDKRGLISALFGLATVQTELMAGLEFFKEGFQLCAELNAQLSLAGGLEKLAYFYLTSSRFRPAAQLLGQAATHRQKLGLPLPPVEQPRYEACRAGLVSKLGETAYAAEFEAGQTTTFSISTLFPDFP